MARREGVRLNSRTRAARRSVSITLLRSGHASIIAASLVTALTDSRRRTRPSCAMRASQAPQPEIETPDAAAHRLTTGLCRDIGLLVGVSGHTRGPEVRAVGHPSHRTHPDRPGRRSGTSRRRCRRGCARSNCRRNRSSAPCTAGADFVGSDDPHIDRWRHCSPGRWGRPVGRRPQATSVPAVVTVKAAAVRRAAACASSCDPRAAQRAQHAAAGARSRDGTEQDIKPICVHGRSRDAAGRGGRSLSSEQCRPGITLEGV